VMVVVIVANRGEWEMSVCRMRRRKGPGPKVVNCFAGSSLLKL